MYYIVWRALSIVLLGMTAIDMYSGSSYSFGHCQTYGDIAPPSSLVIFIIMHCMYVCMYLLVLQIQKHARELTIMRKIRLSTMHCKVSESTALSTRYA